MLDEMIITFFGDLVFSFVNERTKLKLIKYNKYYQKNLDINIINYKILSGRYIIYDEEGKRFEYNS